MVKFLVYMFPLFFAMVWLGSYIITKKKSQQTGLCVDPYGDKRRVTVRWIGLAFIVFYCGIVYLVSLVEERPETENQNSLLKIEEEFERVPPTELDRVSEEELKRMSEQLQK